MHKWFYSFRFYTYGRESYQNCMEKLFINNLDGLRQINFLLALFAGGFSLFPLFIERDFIKMGVCLAVAVVALLLYFYTNYLLQTTIPSNRVVYIIMIIYYINLIILGIYLCIFAAPVAGVPDRIASLFLAFLICALLMFVNSPLFNLYLTTGAMILFITISVIFKPFDVFKYDIINVFLAGCLSLFFTWHITKWRLGLELSTTLLEEERNKYLNQSTTDELTQLNNRRDFMQTFQRFLTNYRTSDNWLCVSISDIDFFKNYNDHYGHPQGDECLRSVGKAFAKLSDELGVYTARVGGEEFAMLWFEKDVSNVDVIVTRMFELIKEINMPHEKSKVSDFITLSMGIFIEKCGTSTDVQTLYDLADKALYSAKGGGRNCAVITGRGINRYKVTLP